MGKTDITGPQDRGGGAAGRRSVLRQRARTVAPAGQQDVQFVTFTVGDEEYGIEIGAIREVVRPLRITPLPRMPRFVEGVVNLRGAIIPVVDLRKRFEAPVSDGSRRAVRMIITRGAAAGGPGADLLGLVVDAVQEVVALPRDRIDRAPQAATGAQADFIAGVAKSGDRLIVLIDLTKILSREERAALAEAGDGDA